MSDIDTDRWECEEPESGANFIVTEAEHLPDGTRVIRKIKLLSMSPAPTSAQMQLDRIKSMHVKASSVGGMTDGYCTECGYIWPCPTYHVAAGWGLDSFYKCTEEKWCEHAQVVMR